MLRASAGVRNDFLVNMGTEAALRYNDNSVNENGHAALAFELLYKQQHNFIEHLNEDERRFFRRTVVNVILATDMSLHDNHLQVWQCLRFPTCQPCLTLKSCPQRPNGSASSRGWLGLALDIDLRGLISYCAKLLQACIFLSILHI